LFTTKQLKLTNQDPQKIRSYRTNNAIKMMIGIGMPRKYNSIERMIVSWVYGLVLVV
jgi:hypothetical protein